MGESLDPVLLSDMDAYWGAANYLSLAQMYLLANPKGSRRSRYATPTVLLAAIPISLSRT